ncbi:glycosyltransferase family 2 protein [Psychroserpens damuponensis]|uniref:glycosyltransferase family 2 protein n=1 Tax=Psychroserpens damuponensis TaxID=943936 RepID=UPI00069437CA|nr:glycosyltransferase family A protein [Psychroserpens damuponensis]
MNFKEFKLKYQEKDVLEIPNRVVDNPLLSICVQTYNHEHYIRQCLDGILMQQTNFDFEILLGEDQSNDKTRIICKEYAQQFPDKIKLFLHHRENNIIIGGRPSGRFNLLYNLYSAKGRYLALCEGDDYWTDPFKLQKQVDFLETNPDYDICAHKVFELNDFNKKEIKKIPNIDTDTDYLIEDYILGNKTGTCSLVFESKYIKYLPKLFNKLPFGDLGIVLTVLKHSNKKMKVFNEEMGVYRVHSGGVHAKFRSSTKKLISNYKQHLNFVSIIEKDLLFEDSYRISILKKRLNTYWEIKRLARINKMYLAYGFYKIRYELIKMYLIKTKNYEQ